METFFPTCFTEIADGWHTLRLYTWCMENWEEVWEGFWQRVLFTTSATHFHLQMGSTLDLNFRVWMPYQNHWYPLKRSIGILSKLRYYVNIINPD